MVLNPREKAILAILIKGNRWMTTSDIAKLARMSWNTAFNYLDGFYKRGWIYKKGYHWRAKIKPRY